LGDGVLSLKIGTINLGFLFTIFTGYKKGVFEREGAYEVELEDASILMTFSIFCST